MFVTRNQKRIQTCRASLLKAVNYINLRITSVLYAGTKELSVNETRVTVIVNSMAAVPAILATIMAPILYLVYDDFRLLVSPVIEACILAIVPILNHLKKHAAAKILVFATHSIGIVYFGLLLGEVANIEVIMIWMIGLSVQIFTKRKHRLIAWGIVLACLVYFTARFGFTFAKVLILSSAILLNFMVMYFFTRYFKMEIAIRSKEYNKINHESRGLASSLRSITGKWSELPCNADGSITIPKAEVNQMHKITTNLNDLNNNALDYALLTTKPQDLQNVTIHLPTLFYDIIDLYTPVAEMKNVTIEPHIDRTMPITILGDRDCYKIIISNILTNAIKFTDRNSTVQITCKKVGKFLWIAIKDHGPGIPDDQKAKIFKPFVSERNKDYAGTGIGLTLVANYVTLLDGVISVESVLGEGSTFKVLIPAAFLEKAPAIEQMTDTVVMVIEDDIAQRMSLARSLKGIGCIPIEIAEVDDIISLVSKHQPDIIIIDNKLGPNSSGLQYVKQLKDDPNLKHIPVILRSGDVIPKYEWKRAGAFGHLKKGSTLDDLKYYIETALDKNAVLV